jgi:hypothetical protein
MAMTPQSKSLNGARQHTTNTRRAEFISQMVARTRDVRDRVSQDHARMVLEGVYNVPHNQQENPFGGMLTTNEIDTIIARAWGNDEEAPYAIANS